MPPKAESAQSSLLEPELDLFQDLNFGVKFNHSSAITIGYESTEDNPHYKAGRVMLLWQEKPIGGLIIHSSPPPGAVDMFESMGKDNLKKKFNASAVDYEILKNQNDFKFHVFRGKMDLEGTDTILLQYIHVRDTRAPLKPSILEAKYGTFMFELFIPKSNYEVLKPEIQIVIDSFRIVDQSSHEELERARLITKVVKYFEDISKSNPNEGKLKCYQRDASAEVILEIQYPEGEKIDVKPNERSEQKLIEILGEYFIVKELMEFGWYDLSITLVKFSHDGKEIDRTTVRFDDVLSYYEIK